MNARQLHWAAGIVARCKAMGLPADQGQRAADIALATALVESNLQMYANGNNPESLRLPHDAVGYDHGSVGLYQQQVGGAYNSSADWGTTAQCMDVNHSTDSFVRTLLSRDWLNMSNGEAAQSVQGSAFPDRYAARTSDAIALRTQLWHANTPAIATRPPADRNPLMAPTLSKEVQDEIAAIVAQQINAAFLVYTQLFNGESKQPGYRGHQFATILQHHLALSDATVEKVVDDHTDAQTGKLAHSPVFGGEALKAELDAVKADLASLRASLAPAPAIPAPAIPATPGAPA